MIHDSNLVPAVDRAINILEYVGNSNQSVTVKELAKNLNIPIASCFRTVKNLVARGYLIEDYNISGQFILGFSILKLSNQLLHKLDIRSISVVFMRELAVKTNQAVQLGILQEKGVMYIEQVLPIKPVSVIAPLRTTIPINVSAAGKILCAYLPLHIRADYLRNLELSQYTENSITQIDSFIREIETAKENGYAVDNQEYSIGIGCLAVPIFDFNKQCVAALGLTGPINDYRNPDKFNEMLSLLKKDGIEISKRMGYNP